jgi:hypothetical protein
MGQAKRRGTFEQRLALAIERDKAKICNAKRQDPTPNQLKQVRKSVMSSLLILSALYNKSPTD